MKSAELIKKLKPAYDHFHREPKKFLVDVTFKKGQEKYCGGNGVWELVGIAKDGHVIQMFQNTTICTPRPEQIKSIKIIK